MCCYCDWYWDSREQDEPDVCTDCEDGRCIEHGTYEPVEPNPDHIDESEVA